MLAASLVVPKDGGVSFHPAAGDPWGDVAAYTRSPAPRDAATQSRRLNSRSCVVSVAAAMTGAQATALPWQPAHEAPGWWELLLRRYFPGAEQLRCAGWDQMIARVRETGPGTGGVVWVRRCVGGVEARGHLLYAHNKDGQVAFLDSMTGGLARLDTAGVRELVFARLRPQTPAEASGAVPAADPYPAPARDFASAARRPTTGCGVPTATRCAWSILIPPTRCREAGSSPATRRHSSTVATGGTPWSMPPSSYRRMSRSRSACPTHSPGSGCRHGTRARSRARHGPATPSG
ncbi:hypothetical protein GUY61_34170 [Streptomyces sp. GC420]|nr:hypothetical protein [Streptomyces sp. GC420]